MVADLRVELNPQALWGPRLNRLSYLRYSKPVFFSKDCGGKLFAVRAFVAWREGFEPPAPNWWHLFSKQARSTKLRHLHKWRISKALPSQKSCASFSRRAHPFGWSDANNVSLHHLWWAGKDLNLRCLPAWVPELQSGAFAATLPAHKSKTPLARLITSQMLNKFAVSVFALHL